MKIFTACLGTETNTFSPLPTGMETFKEGMLYRGDATKHPENLFSGPLHVWRRAGEAQQAEIVESIAAFAQPAGITVRKVYEQLRDELLADLKKALPVDMVLISLHGAMVADGYDDCEGDLLTRIRALVGPKTAVAAELDLHCSITPEMTKAADALVTFKEYPHVDGNERAAEVFKLALAKHQGAARPVMAVHDTRMINIWRTTVEPMAGFVREMKAAEGRNGILSVSFAHGFPMGDVPHTTGKVIVVADGDEAKAQRVAAEFGRKIWAIREAMAPPHLSIDQAIDKAIALGKGPVVMADISDNPGGGTPGDATFLLRRLLERKVTDIACGIFWDPLALRFCMEAGEGAKLALRLGGKCGPTSGDPLDLDVTVRAIKEDAAQPALTGITPMGPTAWLSLEGGIDLIVNGNRMQTFHPQAFTQFGIELSQKKIVVVKSTQHFYAGFKPIAAEVLYVDAPGAMRSDYHAIPFKKINGPYWPNVADPFKAS